MPPDLEPICWTTTKLTVTALPAAIAEGLFLGESISGSRLPTAPKLVWAAAAGLLLLIATEWALPVTSSRVLQPLGLPAPARQTQAPSDLAASARDIVVARPLFAISRRPVPVAAVAAGPAASDRISGIISGVAGLVAIMQPKDGSKPVTLQVGDRFQGKFITAIGPSGVTLTGGTVVRPAFAPAGTGSTAVIDGVTPPIQAPVAPPVDAPPFNVPPGFNGPGVNGPSFTRPDQQTPAAIPPAGSNSDED